MEMNELSIFILIIAISFSVVGVSVQIMRILGTSNDAIKLSLESIRNLNRITTKITEDYSKASSNILALTEAISRIGTNIIDPVVGVFGFLNRFKRNNEVDD